MTPHRPHRIARLYHLPRTLGFALAFAASLFLFFEGLVAWGWLPVGALILVVYPHLAYARAHFVRDGKAAELQHLFLDAIVLGFWAAVIGFNTGLAFALLAAVCLNNAMLGGWRRLGMALVLYAVGAAVGFAVSGMRFDPTSSQLVTFLGMLGILIYMVMVALMFHQQNALMMRVQHQNERRREIFEHLAQAGLDKAKAECLDELLESTLSHLQGVMPSALGMGLIVREDTRPGLIHGAVFRGFDDAVQQQWVKASSAVRTDGEPQRLACLQYQGRAQWFPVGHARSHMSALLLISMPEGQTPDVETIELFVQQLAVALDNHALTQRLTALANTDGLTGLANRSHLDDRLAQVIRNAQSSYGDVFSIVMADINGLKVLNDDHGHEAGDHLIMAAARVLRDACRETDLVARTGGDEFVILCPSTIAWQARHVVDRIRKAAASEHVTVVDMQGRPQLVSLSLSLGHADSTECAPRDVMRLADQNMYADKERHYRERSRV